jgi:hypothetical protein
MPADDVRATGSKQRLPGGGKSLMCYQGMCFDAAYDAGPRPPSQGAAG